MMQLEKYSELIAPEKGEHYQSGKYWIQQLRLMQNDRVSRVGIDPDREPYTTIDDLIRLAQELSNGLSKLGEYKHPLHVRKGVKNMVERKERSKTVKAGSKTYFFDIKETAKGKPYLVVTESRFKGKSEERERSTIVVFQENAKEFAEAVSQMVSILT